MTVFELLGRVVGVAIAPLTAAGSFLRRARLFHPDGVVYRAEVTRLAESGPARELGERLAGPALVRLSSAWWKKDVEWPDVLGVAIRFRADDAITTTPSPGDQDLLLATILRPWTLPLAPFTTDVHSFLDNDYRGVSPFDAGPLGRARIKLTSPRIGSGGSARKEALEKAVAAGAAVFELVVKPEKGGEEVRVARIKLLERVPIDQEALRFDPFRTGRGIVPRGFIHNLRRATYAASQWARPDSVWQRRKGTLP